MLSCETGCWKYIESLWINNTDWLEVNGTLEGLGSGEQGVFWLVEKGIPFWERTETKAWRNETSDTFGAHQELIWPLGWVPERRGSEGEGGEGRWGWDGDWAHRLATPANGDRCNGVATSARWFSSSVAAKGGLKSCKSWVKTLYVGKGDRGRLLGIQLALSKCLSKKEGE